MAKKHYVVCIILIFVVIAIIISQVFWIMNMYGIYKRELVFDINKALEKAVMLDVEERSKGNMVVSKVMPLTNTIWDAFEKMKSSNANVELVYHRDICPLPLIVSFAVASTVVDSADVSLVNKFFFQEMNKGKFEIQDTYVELYDYKQNILLESSANNMKSFSKSYLSSDMKKKMFGNKGIIAYVCSPVFVIFKKMTFQFFLSVVLIILAVIGLYYLGRTIFRQWKEEKMRQDSVDAMTHEFRKPIAAAVSLTSMIPYYMAKGKNDEVSLYAERAAEELSKLTAYTKRIQQINNNDKSTVILDKTEIKISLLMELLIEKYYSPEINQELKTNNKTLTINFNIHPECKVIVADRVHFSNIIDNLIDNAIKYSFDKIDINISVDFDDNFIRISIKDNGIGISTYDIKNIFDKYYRSKHQAVKCKVGYGLGLTYVKSIVELHSGRIEAKSMGVGAGSEFILFWPVDNSVN